MTSMPLVAPLTPDHSAAARSGIDALRIVAAFFIVWDHSFAPGWQYCDPALSVFLILTAYLSQQAYHRDQSGQFWTKRLTRLMLPWVFWCAVYWALNLIVSDRPTAWLSDPYSLLVGPKIHLWFLPFCAIFLLLVPLAARFVQSRSALIAACILLAAATLPLQYLHSLSHLPEPFAQWSLALPLYAFGLLHTAATRMDARRIILTAAAVISALSFALYPQFWALQMLLGAALFELAWHTRINSPLPARLARYAFGIYLMHPAFELLAHKIAGDSIDPVGLALFSFIGALAGTHIFLRLPVLRKTV